MRLAVAALLALTAAFVAPIAGCHGGKSAAGEPAKRAPLKVVKAAAPADALARVVAHLPARTGSCAQVKSVNDRAKADSIASDMRDKTKLPVEIVKADLGDRGTWWRLCVGDEGSEAKLVALATKWTSPGGELEPWLDKSADNAPRFFVLEKSAAEERRASDVQAKALYSTKIVDGAPVLFFGPKGAQSGAYVASTSAAENGGTEVVAVDAKGDALGFDDAAAPGCASCELALREAPVRARKAMSAADFVGLTDGDELIVDEETAKGVHIASIVAPMNGALKRIASIVVEDAKPGFIAKASVQPMDADADVEKELAVETSELVVDGDSGCSLEHHAAVYDVVADKGLVKIDPVKLPPSPAEAVIDVVTALDAAGDHDAASKTCAAQLSREAQAQTAQLCLQRVRRLKDAGALVDAVNAAGLLADASPPLRPLVAASFSDAVAALDKDPHLSFDAADCKARPLVAGVHGKSVDDVLKIASEQARDRVLLSDVVDAVLVTGARDFGPDSPVGAVTLAWLGKAKQSLPARAAAVEALLLPQAAP